MEGENLCQAEEKASEAWRMLSSVRGMLPAGIEESAFRAIYVMGYIHGSLGADGLEELVVGLAKNGKTV